MSHSPEIEEGVKNNAIEARHYDGDTKVISTIVAKDLLQTTQKEMAEGIVGEIESKRKTGVERGTLWSSKDKADIYNKALADLTTHIKDKYLIDKE